MKMYIPEIGDVITLSKDWEFIINDESKNKSLTKALNVNFDYDVEIKGDGKVLPEYNKIYKSHLNNIVIGNRDSDSIFNILFWYSYTENHDLICPLKYKHYDISIKNNKTGKHVCSKEKYTISLNDWNYIGSCNIDIDAYAPICTLPKNTKLKIDRIYIRKGASDFSSITFIIEDCPDKTFMPKKKIRFWAKLKDVNNISFN